MYFTSAIWEPSDNRVPKERDSIYLRMGVHVALQRKDRVCNRSEVVVNYFTQAA